LACTAMNRGCKHPAASASLNSRATRLPRWPSEHEQAERAYQVFVAHWQPTKPSSTRAPV
jgi:hypothetical protein